MSCRIFLGIEISNLTGELSLQHPNKKVQLPACATNPPSARAGRVNWRDNGLLGDQHLIQCLQSLMQ